MVPSLLLVFSLAIASSLAFDDEIVDTASLLKGLKPEDLIVTHVDETISHIPPRALEIGDFDRFNTLFTNAQLKLPDAEVSDNGLTLSITNLVCTSVYVGDIQSNYTVFQENGLDVLAYTVSAYPLSITCSADYTFEVLFVPGKGRFTAVAENTRAETRIDLTRAGVFANGPPTTASVEYCNADINTNGNISFEGATLERLLNLFKQLISNVVDNYAADALCDLLSSAGPEALGNLLTQTNSRLDQWLLLGSDEAMNPLAVEQSFAIPDNVNLIDFQPPSNTTASSVSDLFVNFLKGDAESLFGESVVDPVTGQSDLAINSFLRKTLINETTGTWIVDLSAFSDFNPVLFQSHDKLTQSSVSIKGAEVTGLDTLQTFRPFMDIGSYTVSNSLQWSTLSMVIALIVDIRPSTRSDSILLNPDPVNIVEEITVRIDFTNVNLDLAIFMPIDKDLFEAISLGSILSTKNILPCFLSALHALEIAGLNVSVSDISVPTLEGFISPGIDRLVTQLAEAAFVAYEPSLLRALPGIFQGSIRSMIKTRLIDSLINVGDSDQCLKPTIDDGANGAPALLDFRDLFLSPIDATSAGATGQQPYGNVGHLIYNFMQNLFNEIGEDGLPEINQVLIQPFTQSQSGTPGLIRFTKNVLEFGTQNDSALGTGRSLAGSFLDSFGGLYFSLGDIRISNIDSIAYPLELLNTTESSSILSNNIAMGSGAEKTLNFTIRVVAGPSDALNEIDVTASIENMNIIADIQALIIANRFLQFPLGDIMNYHCWLAAFFTMNLNDEGFVDPGAVRSLQLVDFAASISSFSIFFDCVTCVSAGTVLLPELLQILNDAGTISTLTLRLPSLLDSLSMSSSTQTFFDRLVVESDKFCPSSSGYIEDAAKSEYGKLGFPSLDSLSVDTLLYAGLLVAQVGAVVFAETQRSNDTVPSDPLSVQSEFVIPTDVRLLDWTDIGNSTGLGNIADDIFYKARTFLLGDFEDMSDFGDVLGGILGNDGVLNLVTDIKLVNDGITISIDSLQVRGLDAISITDVLEPIAAQTLSFAAFLQTLDLDIVLSASGAASSEPAQIVTTSLSLQNVSFAVALFAAFDLDKLGTLQLGSFLDTRRIVQCVLSAAHHIEISQMKVSVESFSNLTFSGFRDDTASALAEGTRRIVDRFGADIVEAIPLIFDGIGKKFLSSFLDSSGDRCSNGVEFSESSFLDFRDLFLSPSESTALGGSGQSQYGNLFRIAFSFIQEKMLATDPNTGLARINSGLISDFTKSQSGQPGKLYFDGDLLQSEERIQAGGLDAKFRLRLYDAYVNNLDTIGAPILLLEPTYGQPYQLNNNGTIGLSRPLELGIRLFFGLANEDSNIENELEIRFHMEALQILLSGWATVSENAFMGFPISDVTNLQCWLATIPAPTLDSRGLRVSEGNLSLSVMEFLATASEIWLNVSCIECSGPRIPELGVLLSGIEGSESFTDVVNAGFELIRKLVEGNFLQLSIDRMLNDAKKMCPHSFEYNSSFTGFEYEAFDVNKSEHSISFFLGLVVVCVSLSVIVLAILLTTKLIVRRRHVKWIKSLPQRQLDLLWKEQRKNDDEDAFINVSTESMFRSVVIPSWIRWFMILVLLGNIAFFLSGHLSLAASVTIMASLGGQTFTEEGFFEFSIAKSTIEIWNAGGQELAILIFLFSFIWPYTKTVLTMALWFAPPTMVSVVRRGSILLWLDFLAKWSTIDIFVLIVTIVSFRVSVQSPDVAFLPEGFYSLNLLVAPKWGLYANLTAQIISQLSSHVIIHFHRRIVETASKNNGCISDIVRADTVPLDDENNEIELEETPPTKFVSPCPARLTMNKEKLCQQAFRRPHRGDVDKLVPRRFVGSLLVLLALCSCVLVVFGCVSPSYSVSALGIVGVLVESGQKFTSAETSYSVFTTITLLFDQARLTGTAADYIGLGTLSFILLSSVLLAPIAQSIVLLVQWFTPLTRKRRHRLMILLEVLQAWQYAEVYLLAIIVGSWQLGPISEFMINPYCESLQRFFSEMVHYGLLKVEDAQCFRTDVTIEPTFYILFTSAICLALINSFVMKAVTQYFREIHVTCIQDVVNENVLNLEDIADHENSSDGSRLSQAKSKIHPVPVLFTDRYRWLLRREDEISVSRKYDNPVYPSDSFCSEQESNVGNETGWGAVAMPRDTDVVSLSLDDSSLYTHETVGDRAEK